MRKSKNRFLNALPAVIALAIIVFIWYLLGVTGAVPEYMLPSPAKVVLAMITDFKIIAMHGVYSLAETVIGLLIGIALAFVTATLMERFLILEKALNPIILITQTIPTIAIAPLLVLWMGFGMAPKITLVVITTYFPIAVGLASGYKSADKDAVDLMKAMGAGRVAIFRHVKFPAALPSFFSGLKISASYAVVGAVISEWLGGFNGLGVYMTRMQKAYSFDKMFAVIIYIIIISLILMGIVSLLRKAAMPWLNAQEIKKDR